MDILHCLPRALDLSACTCASYWHRSLLKLLISQLVFPIQLNKAVVKKVAEEHKTYMVTSWEYTATTQSPCSTLLFILALTFHRLVKSLSLHSSNSYKMTLTFISVSEGSPVFTLLLVCRTRDWHTSVALCVMLHWLSNNPVCAVWCWALHLSEHFNWKQLFPHYTVICLTTDVYSKYWFVQI